MIKLKIYVWQLKDKTHTTLNHSKTKNQNIKECVGNNERDKWVARIRTPDGKRKKIGRYDTEEEAHKAYEKASGDIHKEYKFNI